MSLYLNKKPFILADQLGVLYKYSYRGVGGALFDEFFKDIIGNKSAIYAEILHKPVKNKASINFCKKLGFEEINELTNSDRNTWGIYRIKSYDEK